MQTAKNFYLRDGVWYYCAHIDGTRIRKSTGCDDLEEARRWVNDRYPKKKPKKAIAQDPFQSLPFKITTKFISDLHYRMKSRFPNDPVMKRSELVEMLKMSDGRCQLTGIPFVDYSLNEDRSRKPYIPSVDRIDPKKPYTRDNCRIVCLAVNLAMNDWGQDVFDLIAFYRIKHRLELV